MYFKFSPFILNYPNCPITKYELTDSTGTAAMVPTGIQSYSGASPAEITLEAGQSDYKVYAADQLLPGTVNFYLLITITGGMEYNFGAYSINLMCGKTTGGVVTTSITISEPISLLRT